MSERSLMDNFHVGDGLSLASLAAAFTGALPAIGALFAIIWYALMIWDWIAARRRQPCPVTTEEHDV